MRRLTALLGFACAALFAALASAAISSKASEKIVVLPLENLSGVEAARELQPLLEAQLKVRGYDVLGGKDLEPLLEKAGIRYLDSVERPVGERLLQETAASGVLHTTVGTYLESINPVVAISARMISSDGSQIWADVSGLSANDLEKAFGFGRPKSRVEVATKALDRLFSRFPRPGEISQPRSTPGGRLGLSRPRTYVSSSLPRDGRPRICILPFRNDTPAVVASRIVGELLAGRFANSGRFSVVESQDLMSAVRQERFQSLRSSDPAALKAVARRLGASLFVRGTIFVWREVLPSTKRDTPRADIAMEIVDGDRGAVVWTSRLSREGTDYRGLLEFGEVSNLVSLADRMFSEMVASAGKTPPTRVRSLSGKERHESSF